MTRADRNICRVFRDLDALITASILLYLRHINATIEDRESSDYIFTGGLGRFTFMMSEELIEIKQG